jgi:hypothetical protein
VHSVAASLAAAALALGGNCAAGAAAAAAVGAAVNKFQRPSDGLAPAALALGLAQEVLLPAVAAAAAPAGGQQRRAGEAAAALNCLGWMACGLAMVRADAWQQLTGAVLDLLPGSEAATASSSEGSAGPGGKGSSDGGKGLPSGLLGAAAGVFEVLVSSSAAGPRPDEGWRLDPRATRARARPLWQQKAFVLALRSLSAKSVAVARAVAEAPAADDASAPAGLAALAARQRALAVCTTALLASAPRAVYRSAAPEVAAQLVPCLARAAEAVGSLSNGDGSAGSEEEERRLHACLLVISDFLSDPSLLPLMEPEADGLIRLFLALAARVPSLGAPQAAAASGVRETSLQCLLAVMQLPYRLLHAHRRGVLRGLGAALDDDARAVRLAAVRAKRAWSVA